MIDVSTLDVLNIFPEQKDKDRAASMSANRAYAQAQAIQDAKKLVRRAKAVAAYWGVADSRFRDFWNVLAGWHFTPVQLAQIAEFGTMAAFDYFELFITFRATESNGARAYSRAERKFNSSAEIEAFIRSLDKQLDLVKTEITNAGGTFIGVDYSLVIR